MVRENTAIAYTKTSPQDIPPLMQDFMCGLTAPSLRRRSWRFLGSVATAGYPTPSAPKSTYTAAAAQWQVDYYNNGWQTVIFGAVTPNTWYYVELKLVIGSGTGETRLYLDGAEVFSQTGLTNTAPGSSVRNFCLGVDDEFGNNNLSVFYDAVALSESYIGPTSVSHTPTPTPSPSATPTSPPPPHQPLLHCPRLPQQSQLHQPQPIKKPP